MHRIIALLLVLSIALAMTGCGPSVSSKDLGTIIYKIPHVQGADKPYELPKVISPTPETPTPDVQDEEGTKTGQNSAEVEKEGKQAIPDKAKGPRPTPAHRP